MIRILLSTLLGFSPVAFGASMDVANRAMKCGKVKLRFGPDAEIVAFDDRRMEVKWDSQGVSATIGDHDFGLVGDGTDAYELDGKPCKDTK